MTRPLPALATLAALTLATLPAHATPPSCEEAQDDFWATWEAEAHEPTKPVALAARDVVDACPHEDREPTPGGEGTGNPVNDLHRAIYERVEKTLRDVEQLALGEPGQVGIQETTTPARLCGFTTAANSGPRDAQTQGWIMVGTVTKSGTDAATGSATYDAVSGYVHFNAVGPIWGVDTNNQGTGTLYFHGVPFPLYGMWPKNDVVQADAGCGIPPGPELCWGSGYGNIALPMGAIAVAGNFYDCH